MTERLEVWREERHTTNKTMPGRLENQQKHLKCFPKYEHREGKITNLINELVASRSIANKEITIIFEWKKVGNQQDHDETSSQAAEEEGNVLVST